MKRKIFQYFGLVIILFGLISSVVPATAFADILPTQSVDSNTLLDLVTVNVSIAGINNSDPHPGSFSGDEIVQSAGTNNYYIADAASGKQLYQIPSSINIAIFDVGSGLQFPTYCDNNSATTFFPCGGDQATLVTPLAISPDGNIAYSAYFNPADEYNNATYKNSTSNLRDNFVACPSGPNITTTPKCTTNASGLAHWTVESSCQNYNPITAGTSVGGTTDCDDIIGAGGNHGQNGTESVDITLPLPASYVAPPAAQGSGGPAAQTPSCETSGFTLAWIACPIVNALAGAIDGIENGMVIPLLKSPPITLQSCSTPLTSTGDCTGNASGSLASSPGQSLTYKVWSSFRDIADILLVVFLLVIVFGESIGGGMIDAYTAKKVLPRLLIAAILVNLSIYLVAAAIDVTNVVGGGIGSLLRLPFNSSGSAITLNGGAAGAVTFTSLVGETGAIWVAATTVASIGAVGVAGTAVAAAGVLAPFLPFFLLFILLPAVIVFISILVTVILRQGLILLLVLVSPIGFVLYCLPNTEKYFRQWWEWLFKALLIYPLIVIMFAIASDLSITMSSLVSIGQSGPLAMLTQLLSIVALIIPLAMIPFAFRIAGGLLGKTHELLTNYGKRGHEAIKGNINDQSSLRNRARRRAQAGIIENRAQFQTQYGAKGSMFRRGLTRAIGGGPNIFEKRAALTQQSLGIMKTTQDLDSDAFIRAATINPRDLDRLRATPGRTGFGDDGVEYFKSADGMKHSEATIRSAYAYYRSHGQKIGAFSRVMEKADSGTPQDQDNAFADFISMASDMGMDKKTATGHWEGVTIPYKNIRMDLRRRTIDGEKGSLRAGAINQESFLKEASNTQMYGYTAQTEGTAINLADNVIEAYNTPRGTGRYAADESVEAYNTRRKQATEAGQQMYRYSFGAGHGPQDAQQGNEALPEGLRQAYATSDSAAWKNSQAFKQQTQRIMDQTEGLLPRPTPPGPQGPGAPGGPGGIIIPPRGWTPSRG